MAHLNLRTIFHDGYDYSKSDELNEVVAELTRYITTYSSVPSHPKDIRAYFRDQGTFLYQICLDREDIPDNIRAELLLITCQYFNIYANLSLQLIPNDFQWEQHLPKSTFKLHDSASVLLLKVYTRTIKGFIDAGDYDRGKDLFEKALTILTKLSDTAVIKNKHPSIVFHLYFNAMLVYFENHQFDEAFQMAKEAYQCVLEPERRDTSTASTQPTATIRPLRKKMDDHPSSKRHKSTQDQDSDAIAEDRVHLVNECALLSNQLYNYTIELVHLRYFKMALKLGKLSLQCVANPNHKTITTTTHQQPPTEMSINTIERQLKLHRLLSICYFERNQLQKALQMINTAIAHGEQLASRVHSTIDNAQNYYFRCKILLSMHQQQLNCEDDEPFDHIISFTELHDILLHAFDRITDTKLASAVLSSLPFIQKDEKQYNKLALDCYHVLCQRHPHDIKTFVHIYLLWLVKSKQLGHAYQHLSSGVTGILPETVTLIWGVCVNLYDQKEFSNCSKWCQLLISLLPKDDILNLIMVHIAFIQSEYMQGHYQKVIQTCEDVLKTITDCELTSNHIDITPYAEDNQLLSQKTNHSARVLSNMQSMSDGNGGGDDDDNDDNNDMTDEIEHHIGGEDTRDPSQHGNEPLNIQSNPNTLYAPPTVEHYTRLCQFRMEALTQLIRSHISLHNVEEASRCLTRILQLDPSADVLCLLCEESHRNELDTIERVVLAWMVEHDKHIMYSKERYEQHQSQQQEPSQPHHDPTKPISSYQQHQHMMEPAIVISLALLKLDTKVILKSFHNQSSDLHHQQSDSISDSLPQPSPSSQLVLYSKGTNNSINDHNMTSGRNNSSLYVPIAPIIATYSDITRFQQHLGKLCDLLHLPPLDPSEYVKMVGNIIAFVRDMHESTIRANTTSSYDQFHSTLPSNHGLLQHPTVEIIRACDDGVTKQLHEAVKCCWNIILLCFAAHLFQSAYRILCSLGPLHVVMLQVAIVRGEIVDPNETMSELIIVARHLLLIASCFQTIFDHPYDSHQTPPAIQANPEWELDNDHDYDNHDTTSAITHDDKIIPPHQHQNPTNTLQTIPGYLTAMNENRMSVNPQTAAMYMKDISQVLHAIISLLEQYFTHLAAQNGESYHDTDIDHPSNFNSNHSNPSDYMNDFFTAKQCASDGGDECNEGQRKVSVSRTQIQMLLFLTTIIEFRSNLYLKADLQAVMSCLPQKLSLPSLDILIVDAIKTNCPDIAIALLRRRIKQSSIGTDTPITSIISMTREMLLLESDHNKSMQYVMELTNRLQEYYCDIDELDSNVQLYKEIAECREARALCITAYNQAIMEFNLQRLGLAKTYLEKVIELRKYALVIPWTVIRQSSKSSDRADHNTAHDDIENIANQHHDQPKDDHRKLSDPFPQEGRIIQSSLSQITHLYAKSIGND